MRELPGQLPQAGIRIPANENQRSILRSKPRIDFTGKIGISLRYENRLRIFPELFLIAIVFSSTMK
jgi:hypothetical protein